MSETELKHPVKLKIISEDADLLSESKEWPNYAWGDIEMLSLVDPTKIVKEKNKLFPRVRPLRKLIVDIVGPIIDEKTVIGNFDFVGGEGYHCAVTNTIGVLVQNPNFLGKDLVGKIVTASAAADGTPFNASEGFNRFATAMADTRAKGRSYVNLLGLDINVAEELMADTADINENTKPSIETTGRPATNSERATITASLNSLAAKHGVTIDLAKICKHMEVNSDKLMQEDVSRINALIRKWFSDVVKIPADLK